MSEKHTVEWFAKKCGVTLERRSPEYGCAIVYFEADSPHTSVGMFRTELAAYRHWMESKFDKKTSRVIMRLLKEQK